MITPAIVVLSLLGTAASGAPAAMPQRELYIVRGYVKDTQGAPVPDVEIIMDSPRRVSRSDPRGYFLLDSVPVGKRRLTARRIGYLPVSPPVLVPQLVDDTLQIIMIQQAHQLAPIDVQVERKGIYGVVGDTAYHALPGTLVEVLGGEIADTTDAQGRFGFDGLRERHYVLRVSRVGYFGRLISVDHGGKGRDLSVFLTPYSTGSYDWANSREALIALPDLAARLAMEPKRNRMTREELDRYGTAAVCDIPRIRSQVGQDPDIVLRGVTWYRMANLCAWTADQLDLLEWGGDPCKESWKSIADVLTLYCGPQRQSSLYARTPNKRKGYVVLWPRS